MIQLLLAEVQLQDRSSESCVADNGLCPDWIADNFDRYVDPFFEHLFLTVVSLAIGFAISFALAIVAYRRRWLVAPVTQVTGIPTRFRAWRPSSCCCRSPAADGPRRSSRSWPTRC